MGCRVAAARKDTPSLFQCSLCFRVYLPAQAEATAMVLTTAEEDAKPVDAENDAERTVKLEQMPQQRKLNKEQASPWQAQPGVPFPPLDVKGDSECKAVLEKPEANQSRATDEFPKQTRKRRTEENRKRPKKGKCNSGNKKVPPPRFDASKFHTDIAWVASMARWLECEQKMSDRNAKCVLRQVVKLAQGKGIGYPGHWPPDVAFYSGRAVNLEYDFDVMLEQARQYQTAYGRDLGHGWLLTHPITKMKLFQTYCGKKARASGLSSSS